MPYGGELDSEAKLLKAAESGDLKKVGAILEKGDVKDDFLQDLLMRKLSHRIAALLIGKGAKDTILLAAGRGDQKAVRKFLNGNVPVDLPDSSTGRTRTR